MRLLDRYEYLLIRVEAFYVGRVWLFQGFPGITEGSLCWLSAVAGACRERVRESPALRVPRVPGPFPGGWREIIPGRNPEARR